MTAPDLGRIALCPLSASPTLSREAAGRRKAQQIRAAALKIQICQPQTGELCPEARSGRLPQPAGIPLPQTPTRELCFALPGERESGYHFLA